MIEIVLSYALLKLCQCLKTSFEGGICFQLTIFKAGWLPRALIYII